MQDINITRLSLGMAEMARTYPNDTIANALARVSRKLESLGTSKFAPQLDKLDKQVIKFYHANTKVQLLNKLVDGHGQPSFLWSKIFMITPCVFICKIDSETQTCIGCHRTAEEIHNWYEYTDDERMQIMKRLGYGKRMGRIEKLRRYDRG